MQYLSCFFFFFWEIYFQNYLYINIPITSGVFIVRIFSNFFFLEKSYLYFYPECLKKIFYISIYIMYVRYVKSIIRYFKFFTKLHMGIRKVV